MVGATATEAKKVGGAVAGAKKVGGAVKPEKVKKVKKGNFVSKEKPASGWEVPMPAGFSFDGFKPLGKKEFNSTATFIGHRAAMLRYRGEKIVAQATALEDKSKRMALLGNEDTAKKVKKAEKLVSAFSLLEKELKDAGVDIDAILAAAKKEKEKASAPATK